MPDLRFQLARLTGISRRASVSGIPTGVTEIDDLLPSTALSRGGFHEVLAIRAQSRPPWLPSSAARRRSSTSCGPPIP